MATYIDGDQPINPIEDDDPTHNPSRNWGLTKREYFAGLAMTELIRVMPYPPSSDNQKGVAVNALRYADALLGALADTPQSATGGEG